jgi:hypothetical protein
MGQATFCLRIARTAGTQQGREKYMRGLTTPTEQTNNKNETYLRHCIKIIDGIGWQEAEGVNLHKFVFKYPLNWITL